MRGSVYMRYEATFDVSSKRLRFAIRLTAETVLLDTFSYVVSAAGSLVRDSGNRVCEIFLSSCLSAAYSLISAGTCGGLSGQIKV